MDLQYTWDEAFPKNIEVPLLKQKSSDYLCLSCVGLFLCDCGFVSTFNLYEI